MLRVELRLALSRFSESWPFYVEFARFHGLCTSFVRFDSIVQNVCVGLSHDELVNWFIG